jgi:hypothetical protein
MRQRVTHPSSGHIERYLSSQLREVDRDRIEEHLLLCGVCRERVVRQEAYAAAVRQAAARFGQREPQGILGWLDVWVMQLAGVE